jgi:cell division septum initiation protein DivIVA
MSTFAASSIGIAASQATPQSRRVSRAARPRAAWPRSSRCHAIGSKLASLYGVTTKRLNEQVRRNLDRFPADFMFQLTTAEATALRSQIATSNTGRGGRRYLPYAFTEHGAIQAANVLNSPRAVEMGIYVVRAFVQLRELLSSNKDLARRLDQLEARIEKKLATHDDAIAAMLSAIRQLMNPPIPKRRPIGFTAKFDEKP